MAYFSNSSEGAYFNSVCQDCIHKDPDALCPIAAVQSMFNYDQCRSGNEDLKEALAILVGEGGECAMRPFIERLTGKPNMNQKCFQRKLCFGDDQQIDALQQLARR